jgi:hypothetical protein
VRGRPLSTIRLCARAGESMAAQPEIPNRRPPNRNARNPPSGRVLLHGAQSDACYSITSSARSSIDGGMARPSAVAVLRFTSISNFVSEAAPGDRPASRRVECDRHRRRRDARCLPCRVRRRASRRLWQRTIEREPGLEPGLALGISRVV